MEEKELIKAEETTVSPKVWSCLNCGTTVPSTQDYCNKCGAYKPEPEPQKPAEPPKKFCKYCGKELSAEATVCTGCGCPTGTPSIPVTQAQSKKKMLLILAIIAAVGLFVGGIFIYRYAKVQSIIDELEGNTYICGEYREYTYISDYYRYRSYTFDDNGECEYVSASSSGYSSEHTWSYKVKVELSGDVIITIAGTDFKTKFDSSGEIESLIDTEENEKYVKV